VAGITLLYALKRARVSPEMLKLVMSISTTELGEVIADDADDLGRVADIRTVTLYP
jgi:hypothetical protein